MSGAGIGEAATAGTVCGTGRGEDASTRVHVERTDVRWRAMPPEPTIPEAAVDAAARAIHRSSCRCEMNPGPHADMFLEEARAALAAATPFLTSTTRLVAVAEAVSTRAAEALMENNEALVAENARLREALIRAREDMEGWAAYAEEYFIEKHDLAGDLAAIDAALAPSDEEPGT